MHHLLARTTQLGARFVARLANRRTRLVAGGALRIARSVLSIARGAHGVALRAGAVDVDIDIDVVVIGVVLVVVGDVLGDVVAVVRSGRASGSAEERTGEQDGSDSGEDRVDAAHQWTPSETWTRSCW
ncbi:MAG TPA: hypothetical protein VL463_23245 [Kofleriaceae bacterium]|nr:hypothetical protein [Kofleriaceae bacterium]